MKIARAYLRREILAAVAMVLLAFLCLFAFFDFLAELEDLGRGDYRLKHSLIFVLLSIPSRAYEVMPIAVLIGSLYALTQFARNSELTVLRAAGVSTMGLMLTLMQIGVIFVASTYVLGEYVAPPLERVAQKWRLRSLNSTVRNDLSSGVWLRDGRLFVNVQRVSADSGLEGVKIFDFDTDYKLTSINVAERGEYSPQQGWLLSGVTQTRFLGDRTELLQMPELRWASELTPEMISVVMVNPERMSIARLYEYTRFLAANAQRSGRYEVALWKKLAYPFVSLVMMGLALPFALGNQRSVNVGARVLTGVMLGIGFYLLNALFSNLGVINNWPALMSAITPSVFFLLLAVALMWMVDRR
ncbi:MAG: LPS export ABC transporter permease LptG [Candidatus Dactylopiibacterium carminicum]|uniref:LPS export ABC transporter permease LptG n=1 Tax=Candidatus Dactylopiibacterium carminicum TaxID=857335 RepID=A0A272EZ06_9RHOO|nr:LPS export ABC transporter permease LptG [Candidatus Dactylopiibacterium carminicum]KAF7600842.1 LPS export ABC transporter permease LptG [Candidatus Dactylopiibacterium carminicum]PAS95341.1 MAG: LPS export ABC transporter permease LptG [Candidatus Dactylopiibacterium carminicum]PAS98647.1 MAG: LPS export ABC transporter permease LptG [Candidatus Dactylopiibacterium carminicum]PAT00846.1 MAG: LPS export ABC transporter permease LptG [Candidatus Dactylopiibacterium carminicum]